MYKYLIVLGLNSINCNQWNCTTNSVVRKSLVSDKRYFTIGRIYIDITYFVGIESFVAFDSVNELPNICIIVTVFVATMLLFILPNKANWIKLFSVGTTNTIKCVLLFFFIFYKNNYLLIYVSRYIINVFLYFVISITYVINLLSSLIIF